jgi:outer membrane receptor for ferrienterochelin and colicin
MSAMGAHSDHRPECRLLPIAMPAFAQDSAKDGDGENGRAIVVTGTLIRGEVPVGTNVVSVSTKDIEPSSATTVAELLTDVPQFDSFNALNMIGGGGNFFTTIRPNLRGLPGSGGTSATLLLIDGHRMVGMGISSTTPDADFVPPGIIERIEIMPDGGSAIYGSDAVAGVVNFITKKRFDGVNVDGTRFARPIGASSPQAASPTGRRQDCFRPTPRHPSDTCNAGAIQTGHSRSVV